MRTFLLIIFIYSTFLANVAQFQDISIFLEAVVICGESNRLNSSSSISSPGIFLEDFTSFYKNSVWGSAVNFNKIFLRVDGTGNLAKLVKAGA